MIWQFITTFHSYSIMRSFLHEIFWKVVSQSCEKTCTTIMTTAKRSNNLPNQMFYFITSSIFLLSSYVLIRFSWILTDKAPFCSPSGRQFLPFWVSTRNTWQVPLHFFVILPLAPTTKIYPIYNKIYPIN